MLIPAAFLLTACAGSTPSINAPIHLPALPSEVEHCQGATVLPDNKLLQKDVERFWARDRANLTVCKNKLNTVVSYYKDMAVKLDTGVP